MIRASLLLAAGVLTSLPRLALGLPDLAPEVYGIEIVSGVSVSSGDVAEGCAASTDDRVLLRFGLRSRNVGPDALVVGDPGCPDCATNPGALCANPEFICSPAEGHNHPHFIDFGRYELLDSAGNLVAPGGKRSFCMRDTACPDGVQTFTDCTYQGISAGCYDDYDPTLGCQYIDLTGVPDATTRAFILRVTIDPDALLPDADRTNNVTAVAIPGCGDGIVQAGEDCDPGRATADCCTADCVFVAAGTPCRASSPCQALATCDGNSAVCPDNAALPCATPPPTCRGCLIDGACHASGDSDPDDPCLVCDPTRRADAWSASTAPTTSGIVCQVARVSTATQELGCPPGLADALSARVSRVRRLAARLASVPPSTSAKLEARLARRLKALSRVLVRATLRARCDATAATTEVERLRQQLQTLRLTQAT